MATPEKGSYGEDAAQGAGAPDVKQHALACSPATLGRLVARTAWLVAAVVAAVRSVPMATAH